MTNKYEHFRQLTNLFIWLLGLYLALSSSFSLAQTQAFLESPSANAFVRSGVGLIRGWACDATQIEISINDSPRLAAGYGTQRPDTASVCGDQNNGFGLTFNWNSIGDGVHHLRAFVDGVEFANTNFTVTTLGQDFITGLVRNYLLPNFPGAGQSTPVRWSEPHQNFVIAQAMDVPPPVNPPPPAPRARLESPTQGSFESGVGLIRGWVCEAARVEISIDGQPRLPTAYGTQRPDTASVCGDLNNGFGLTFNWNSLDDGVHRAQAFADGVEFASVNFAVTTLGADFLTGLDQKVALDDFPGDGQNTTLRWSEPDQNFTLAQTTVTPPKLAIVSVITDLRNVFTVAGAGSASSDATGVRAAKNAQGQPIQLQGVTWTDTTTRQAADIQLIADGLPAVYTDTAGVEARFSAFTDTTATVSFHGPSGNVLAGPVTTPIDNSLILALQEMARRVFTGAQNAEASGGRRLADSDPVRSIAATAEQVFTLSQLLANVYWYGSQAAGEMVCAVERAAATVGASGLIASTACQSPLISTLRARASARQGQTVVPDSGVDPIVQQSLRFDDDVVEAPCDPATDGAACLIQPATQLQARQQAVPPPIPPEPEAPARIQIMTTAGPGGTITPTMQTVNAGATARFTIAPNSGYQIASVTGCGGSLSGVTYTTGPITEACTVSASFAAEQTYIVTATAGLGGTITPATQTVEAGATARFNVTPNSGYVVASVTGCGGSLSGATYTTGPITGNCTVNASFTASTVIVTLQGPLTAQVGTPYSGTFQATGGTSPYTWAFLAGVLPPGFTLTREGTISGTPTMAGSYGFSVQATDRNGATGTGAFTITVQGTVPAAPTGVSASYPAPASPIEVSWNAVAAGEVCYEVYRSTSSSGGGSQVGQTCRNTSFADASADVLTSYWYSVKACNSSGCSPLSSTAEGAIVPSSFCASGVVASDGTYSNTVVITWNPGVGATGYGVTRSDVGWIVFAIAGTSFEDFPVTPHVTYEYTVWSIREGLNSAWTCGSSSDTGFAVESYFD